MGDKLSWYTGSPVPRAPHTPPMPVKIPCIFCVCVCVCNETLWTSLAFALWTCLFNVTVTLVMWLGIPKIWRSWVKPEWEVGEGLRKVYRNSCWSGPIRLLKINVLLNTCIPMYSLSMLAVHASEISYSSCAGDLSYYIIQQVLNISFTSLPAVSFDLLLQHSLLLCKASHTLF